MIMFKNILTFLGIDYGETDLFLSMIPKFNHISIIAAEKFTFSIHRFLPSDERQIFYFLQNQSCPLMIYNR